VNSINTRIHIFIEFTYIILTFHTKNNHTSLSRVFHGTFSCKHDVHQEILEPVPLVQDLGFATTAHLQVARTCSWVIYADKSGQLCRHLTTKDIMRVNELCGVTSEKN
jgi:hypothetical protein